MAKRNTSNSQHSKAGKMGAKAQPASAKKHGGKMGGSKSNLDTSI